MNREDLIVGREYFVHFSSGCYIAMVLGIGSLESAVSLHATHGRLLVAIPFNRFISEVLEIEKPKKKWWEFWK